MRILTVTNLYPTEADPFYGMFVGDQVQALRRHPRVELCEVLFVDGRKGALSYPRAIPELHRLLRRRSFDVVLAHYGITGAIAVCQRRLPVVVVYHGGDLLEKRWQREISRLTYRAAADNVSVSVEGMRRLPGPAHHLTCGIDLDLFAPRDRRGARERFGIDEGELAVLFPSSPHRVEKMYGRFEAVLEQLRGRGQRVRELQLRGLQREEVPEVMAAADVMLLTSRREATPVSIMEALACGLPVVATAVGDVPAMLAPVEGARVVAWSAEAFADATEELIAAAPPTRVPDPQSRRYGDAEITERLVRILEAARAPAR
jgi:glycosyltransferase involved in cell wall biosynthesis